MIPHLENTCIHFFKNVYLLLIYFIELQHTNKINFAENPYHVYFKRLSNNKRSTENFEK